MDAQKKISKAAGDPLIEEIRAVKQAVSARAGHDVVRLCRELQEDQGQTGSRRGRKG